MAVQALTYFKELQKPNEANLFLERERPERAQNASYLRYLSTYLSTLGTCIACNVTSGDGALFLYIDGRFGLLIIWRHSISELSSRRTISARNETLT